MKIALIGAGKTGAKVSELHRDTTIFNSANQATIEGLKTCDIIISFLPGDIFVDYIPMLIEAKIPVITGSTGFEWKDEWIKEIHDKKLVWVRAHNFSLGMNIVKNMIETLSKARDLYTDAQFSIHDIHHTMKVDSPSGTALSWEKWLGTNAKITAERTGDVVGYHHLLMESPVEKIKITHEAIDRAIFAKGALWAAEKAFKNMVPSGLNDFSTIVNNHLKM